MKKGSLILMMAGLITIMGCTRCTPDPTVPPVNNTVNQALVVNVPDGCPAYPDTTVLPVNMIGEQASQWCWAASGEMCMEFLNGGTKICQCDQANNIFPGNGCCDGNNPPVCDVYFLGPGPGDWPCNHVNWPDFKDYSFTAQSTVNIGVSGFTYGPLASGQNYLSFQDLQNQISCKRKPVIFMWQWKINNITDQAHLMVAYGYEVNDSLEGQWVLVHDPAKSYDIIPYSYYITGNNYNHYLDFYNITGPAGP